MILVTGGAGFIGSHIVDELINNSYNVIVADNLSTGRIENINNSAIFYNIDIKDKTRLETLFINNKIKYIIHLAAQASVGYSMKYPICDANENIISSLNLIELAKKYNIKKLIVSSTAAVYGEPQYLPIDENHNANPSSYYGLSKLTMEKYIKLSNIDYIIFRFSNVYGPRQIPEGEAGVVSIFMDYFINNNEINIFGDGNQTRDFIYVKDIAKILFLCIKNDNMTKEIINISSNVSISINELYEKLKHITKKDLKVNYLEERRGDIKHSLLNNSKLLNYIDIKLTNINAGLEKTIEEIKCR
ncbi:NAD-dependent epimerase/dehydratase family protein [Brachyspira aalborgi]|uniref:NAD-dependent epimerase/dehydratase family protein n=1 Tax=Brachyspira aalborgi TaxID=29522 RepID=A0A5C8DY16_9SPIR|nr:NAD-dependent epimerase/dehydratase family protein [Brachyspira aalborgi]TXJ30420.1 NAD-dependent epimerase/dehydratase family protein [Brachyspira aalborgi]